MSDDSAAASTPSPAKKTPKKASAKKSTAKKSSAKKTSAKRSTTKRSTSTRTSATKGAAKKGPAKKATKTVAKATAASSLFARAPVRAKEMVTDPEALRGLADKVLLSESGRTGPLREVADEFKTLGRLIAAYARGDYRDIPLDSLLVVIAGLVYVVSPIDLIPEFVPVLGYADDAVAVGFVVRQVHHELAAFRDWEAKTARK